MTSKEQARDIAREIAKQYLQRGDAHGWFEELYSQAGEDWSIIPWADLTPNPNLLAWLQRSGTEGRGGRALTVGCGMGDDAEELARRGFRVVAFDVAPTAIALCRRRFRGSEVEYTVANLLDPPREWHRAFDFVFECYTLQAMPPELRPRAISNVASLIAPGGRLLLITRARDESEPPGELPWPLTEVEVRGFQTHGLELLEFEDFIDREEPPKRRFRAAFQRPK